MEPNPLAIFLLCVGGAAALIFVLWLNHRLRVPPKRETAQASQAGALEIMISYLFGGVGPVNTFEDDSSDIMSRGPNDAPAYVASSLETDGRQTADRPTMTAPTREQMLDIFRVLRAAGVKRETVQGPWRAAGLKFDNNLWAQAAPPPSADPQAVTPIAGRPTNAQFHDDPELEYQPLR